MRPCRTHAGCKCVKGPVCFLPCRRSDCLLLRGTRPPSLSPAHAGAGLQVPPVAALCARRISAPPHLVRRPLSRLGDTFLLRLNCQLSADDDHCPPSHVLFIRQFQSRRAGFERSFTGCMRGPGLPWTVTHGAPSSSSPSLSHQCTIST